MVAEDQPFATTLSAAFQGDIQRLLELYPDNPALGSPFGTGNDTFGVGLEYKRGAAIITDIAFQAPRRAWVQAATAAGVPTYGYLFTDQNAALQDPVLGGECAGEVDGRQEAALTRAPCSDALARDRVRVWAGGGGEHEPGCAAAEHGDDGLLAVVRRQHDAERREGCPQCVSVFVVFCDVSHVDHSCRVDVAAVHGSTGTLTLSFSFGCSNSLLAQNLIQFDTTAFGNASFSNFAIIPDTFRSEQISFINSVAADFSE